MWRPRACSQNHDEGQARRGYTSYLLRRSYREGGKVRHENLGNLSHLPLQIIEAIRKMLAGRVLVELPSASTSRARSATGTSPR